MALIDIALYPPSIHLLLSGMFLLIIDFQKEKKRKSIHLATEFLLPAPLLGTALSSS